MGLESTSLYPFKIIAGKGIGLTNTSYYTTEIKTLDNRPIGQAGIECFVNAVTGNLCVREQALDFDDVSGKLSLGFTYNSQAQDSDRLWHFSQNKYLIIDGEESTALVLIESDGSETTYKKDLNSNKWIAESTVNGTVSISLEENNQYKRFDPATNLAEYYNLEGHLIARCDSLGNKISFEYSADGVLSKIITSNNTVYMLEKKESDNSLTIYRQAPGKEKTAYKKYNYYPDGYLKSIDILEDGNSVYQTRFFYGAYKKLIRIEQTDNTKLQFKYNEAQKIRSIQAGEHELSQFVYDDYQCHCINANEETFLSVSFLPQGWVDKVQRGDDVSSYSYYPQGKIKSCTYADKSSVTFSYDEETGLFSQIKKPSVITEFNYITQGLSVLKSSETSYCQQDDESKIQSETSFYVYGDYIAKDGKSYPFLRFIVSDQGRVQEFTANEVGLIKRSCVYANDFFDTSPYCQSNCPTIENLEQWSLGKEKHGEKRFEYNDLGQIITQTSKDRVTYLSQDEFSKLMSKSLAIGEEKKQVVANTYDRLQRLKTTVKPGGNTTTYDYIDNESKYIITNPALGIYAQTSNEALNSSRTYQYSQAGKTCQTNLQADVFQNGEVLASKINKDEKITRDSQGRIKLIESPNNQFSLFYYDKLGCLMCTVSPLGYVTTFVNNVENNYKITTAFNNPIDISLFNASLAQGLCPTFKDIQSQVKKSSLDSTNHEFFDSSNRLKYSVNSQNYVTYYHYNHRNQKVASFRSNTALTLEQLRLLEQSASPCIELDLLQDRYNFNYFDKDGLLILEIDDAGYVTQYERNAAGKIQKETKYFNPIKFESVETDIESFVNAVVNMPFDELGLVKDAEKDCQTLYFYNDLLELSATINAEKQCTSYLYNSQGLVKEKRQHANLSVDNKPSSNCPNDKVTKYKYNLLGQETYCEQANGLVTETCYDENNNPIIVKQYDLKNPDSQDADYHRKSITQYSPLGDTLFHASPLLVSHALKDGKEDSDYINSYCDKNEYNEEGLLVSSSKSFEQDGETICLKEIYYYDNLGRKVLTIQANGLIIEETLNHLSRSLLTRKYAASFSQETVDTLAGGYITSELINQLETLSDDNEDILVKRVYDVLGRCKSIVDEESHETKREYNAFGECYKKTVETENKDLPLVVEYGFDKRGLKTSKTKKVGDKELVTRKEYNNQFGKISKSIDENLNETSNTYTLSGQLYQNVNAEKEVTRTVSYDAFNRIIQVTDIENNDVTLCYDDKARTTTTTSNDSILISHSNVFDEVVSRGHSNEVKQTFEHAANGKVTKLIDELGNVTTIKFNLLGLKNYHKDLAGLITRYNYDNTLQLCQQITQSPNKTVSLSIARNVFGFAIRVKGNDSKITKNSYDKRGLLVQSLFDPQNLAILTKTTYSIQGRKRVSEKGRFTKNNFECLLKTVRKYDEFNRFVGTIVDPETKDEQCESVNSESKASKLHIETTLELDDVGQVKIKINAEGFKTFYYYNSLNQKRYEITEEGKVCEWLYDGLSNVRLKRDYHFALEVSSFSSSTPIAQLAKLLKVSNDDSLTWQYFDSHSRLRFSINSLGQVAENCYDLAGNLVKTIKYKQTLDLDNAVLQQLTVSKVAEHMALKPTLGNRIVRHFYDRKGQERFVIDAIGYVTEQRYDASGNTLVHVQYANKLPTASITEAMSVSELEELLTLDDANDRYTFSIYNQLGLCITKISPEGQITKKQYDVNKKVINESVLPLRFKFVKTYEAMLQALDVLESNYSLQNKQDEQVTRYIYDSASRVCVKVDANGNCEKFKSDALGNVIEYTDKDKAVYTFEYDGAGRRYLEITPEFSTVEVSKSGDKLSYSTDDDKKISVKTLKVLDRLGNTISLVQNYGSSNERVTVTDYNHLSKPIAITCPNVLVDDVSKKTSFTESCEQKTSLSTHTVYNNRNLSVASKDAAGNWCFVIYDSANRKAFTINSKGGVTGYQRNAFGEVEKQTQYQTLLKKECIEQLRETIVTVTLDEFVKMCVESGIKDDELNRVTEYVRDDRGDVLSQQSSERVYFNDKDDWGTCSPVITYSYNAFRQQVSTSRLYSKKKDQWATEYFWYDKSGNVICHIDSLKRVTTNSYNVFNYQIVCYQYANPIELSVNPNQAFEPIEQALIELVSSEDRQVITEYDKLGQKLAETHSNVDICELVDAKEAPYQWKSSGKAKMLAKKVDLTERFTYTPGGQKATHTFANKKTKYFFYNSINKLIAESGLPFTSYDKEGVATIITPFTLYGVNEFGQRNFKRALSLGVEELNDYKMPDVILATDDVIELSVFNNRGGLSYFQDNNSTLRVITYAPRFKLLKAREFHTLSEFKQEGGLYTTTTNTDETRYTYNDCGSILTITQLRNDQVIFESATQYNHFNESIAQSVDGKTYPVYTHIDSCKNVWFHNHDNGAATIILYDLLGNQSARFKSFTQDLSTIQYSDLASFVTSFLENPNSPDMLAYFTKSDYAGRAIIQTKPAHEITNASQYVPVNLTVVKSKAIKGVDHSLYWTAPANGLVESFVIWPSGYPELKQELKVFKNKNQRQVKLDENLVTDRYHYQIHYKASEKALSQGVQDKIYHSSEGDINLIGHTSKDAKWFVPEVDGSQLTLLGNTQGLKSIRLIDTTTKKSFVIALELDADDQVSMIDLNDYPSGTYCIEPLDFESLNPIHKEKSLPFTVHSQKPAHYAVAKQFEMKFHVSSLGLYP